jgi:ATP-dependent helicase YprA (DUF1998 family)
MNARPKKASSATSYVSSGNINDEKWVKSGSLSYSISHESQLLTLSTKAFSFCDTCGFAQALKIGRLTKHKDPRNDKECNSTFAQNYFLGHEFKTDVIRLKFEGSFPSCECLEPDCMGSLESASAAIVSASARALGISNADLNSSVQTFGGNVNYINIFDTTPGGIGLTLAISERLNEILLIATRLTTECPNCHENSSCYACLRSYSNQRRHDHLSRAKGRDVISRLLG